MKTAPTVSRPTGASRCRTPARRLTRYASRSMVRSFTGIERPSGREARRLRYSTASCADAVDATSTRTQAMPRMARMLARPYARPFAIAIRDFPESACFFPECLLTRSGLSPLDGFDSVPTVQLRFWFRCRSVATTRTATTTAAKACGVARDLGSAVSTRTTTKQPRPTGGAFVFMDYSKLNGLIPAVIQDADTSEVLMVGFMNDEALERTRNTGFATFFSRTRNKLWMKGETSGNRLAVIDILVDCDDDTVLVKVKRQGDGNVCHTGERSCFFRSLSQLERQTGPAAS